MGLGLGLIGLLLFAFNDCLKGTVNRILYVNAYCDPNDCLGLTK